MASKRFTDTKKWSNPWFFQLPQPAKFLWLYILDECDHGGLWKANFHSVKFHTQLECSHEFIQEHFKEKMLRIADDAYFIPSFADFQYGHLNDKNKAHTLPIRYQVKYGGIEVQGPSSPFKDLQAPSRGLEKRREEKIRIEGRGVGKPNVDNWDGCPPPPELKNKLMSLGLVDHTFGEPYFDPDMIPDDWLSQERKS